MTLLFWSLVGLLYYIYDGYLRVLQLATNFSDRGDEIEQKALPSITVLVTVHNEAAQIAQKLSDVLRADCSGSRVEVLVASDGSTDTTEDIVRAFDDKRVRLFVQQPQQGKSETQNRAIAQAAGDVIVFTDADTRFDEMFLRKIAAPFLDERVGAVDGHLLFDRMEGTAIAKSQGLYWAYELRLRQMESRLGILSVASGACLAVRRNLLSPLPQTVGEDCIVPLDVVLQGYKVVHVDDALAFDRMDSDTSKEFKARVRMTLRNWQGTWSRSRLLNPLAFPGIAFALWSHKLLRWLSPFFLIVATLLALVQAAQGSWIFVAVSAAFAALYAAGALGWLSERKGWNVRYVGVAYSFLLANLAFLLGVWRGCRGVAVRTY